MCMIDDVAEFHKAFNIPIEPKPVHPSALRRELRRRLEIEEHLETVEALENGTLADIAGELVDKIYVAIGTALEYGLPLQNVWNAVHAANMAKLGPDGKPLMREDGKIIKPEGWKRADIDSIVYRAEF